jgi:hypothetical protein
MTELSPQAQAVLDAADAVLEQGSAPTWLVARGIAAALRAAASYCKRDRLHLIVIADELEGSGD